MTARETAMREEALHSATYLGQLAARADDEAPHVHNIVSELRNAANPLGLLPVEPEVAAILQDVRERICAIADHLVKGTQSR